MTRVSTGPPKSAQKYQNTIGFHHNKNSSKTRKILSFPISGLCSRCTEVIQWRKKYRKYKSLSVPRRCIKCDGKSVKDAYHQVCHPCASDSLICAKCLCAWKSSGVFTTDDGNELDQEKDKVFCHDLNRKLKREFSANLTADLSNDSPQEDCGESQESEEESYTQSAASSDDECETDQ